MAPPDESQVRQPRGRSPVIAALVGYFNSNQKGKDRRARVCWTNLEDFQGGNRQTGKLNFLRDINFIITEVSIKRINKAYQ